MRSDVKRDSRTTRSVATLALNRYWRAAEAEQVLAAWQRSGQSAAAFARAHGLQTARLLRWRARLAPAATPRFHPVRVVERGSSAATERTTAEPLELVLRGGRRIRVPADFDAALLEALVRMVEGWGC